MITQNDSNFLLVLFGFFLFQSDFFFFFINHFDHEQRRTKKKKKNKLCTNIDTHLIDSIDVHSSLMIMTMTMIKKKKSVQNKVFGSLFS